MNPGLVRQINDIVRPYRKARMGLLIVISDPVGQRGPTPPLAWQYMIGRNWYKHTIHGTASVNGVHGQQPVEMTLFAWTEKSDCGLAQRGRLVYATVWVSLRALRVSYGAYQDASL